MNMCGDIVLAVYGPCTVCVVYVRLCVCACVYIESMSSERRVVHGLS